jgi:cation diffusion facilitator CzcD-associated flavoprotein CzcO
MEHESFAWVVIGAGPAGIATVGKLIDSGMDPKKIAWIDPEFKVGDFGTQWQKVSSNTKAGLFLKYFNECASFQYSSAPDFQINKVDAADTCFLALAAEPLQWITNHLQETVQTIKAKVQQIKLYDRHWHLTLSDTKIRAKNVVVATGAEPKSLSFSGITEIPLSVALDPNKLADASKKDDVIAVFGASHSAIIILKSLLEVCNVKKVINFYLSPLRYAVYFDDWILFDDTGLKGKTADWARENIDGKLPVKLERIISSEENIRLHLPLCTKAIYANGFQRRLIPVDGMQTLEYNDRSGIIAPGMFGIGIAFPEAKIDRYGTLEYRVGLWKFMDYLNHVMPVWMKYSS